MLRSIFTNRAAKYIGHSSQAIESHGIIFLSAQIGLDMEGNLPDSVEEQTDNCIANLQQIIRHDFSGPTNVIRIQIYLVDLNDFDRVNEELKKWLGETKPAFTVIGVNALPMGAKVQIDMTVSAMG